MKDCLGSSSNLLANNEKDEASLSEQKGCDLVDGKIRNLIDEETLVSAPNGDVEMDRCDGSVYEECSGGSNVGESKVSKGTDNRRKRSRMNGEGESEDGGSVVAKNVLDGEDVQVVVRVLRSRNVTKTKGEEDGVSGPSRGVVVGNKTGESDGFEKKGIELQDKGDHSDVECSGQFDIEVRNRLKRKRGRPPKARNSEGSEKQKLELKKEEKDHSGNEFNDQSANEVREKLKHKYGRPPSAQKTYGSEKKSVEVKKKLKRKRGRPPKVQETDGSEKRRFEVIQEETDQSAGEENARLDNEAREKLKPKRGRPLKASQIYGFEKKKVEVKDKSDQCASEGSDVSCGKVRKKLEPKCGRPPKMIQGKKKLGRPRKSQKGINLRHNVNRIVGHSFVPGKKLVKKDPKVKNLVPKIKFSNDENEEVKANQKAGEMKSHHKQAVRDKIVELLLDAGWTIEYRPRHGRDYKDAVYVNSEGRTHWSVTLAYRMLKKHYEDGGGDAETCKAGFKFTPLPAEELGLLKRVTGKERIDKNKKKVKWNRELRDRKMGGVTKKEIQKLQLHKRKPGRLASAGRKLLKGRTKMKSLLREQDDSAGTSDKGTGVSRRDHKQLQTHGRKRYALMIRNSKESAESNSDGYVLYNGKRTVLAWMIDMGTVTLDTKVQFSKRRKTRAVLKGRVTTDGILCDCCSEIFTISEFEIHAGSKSCQPLKNICLETGPSLLQCQLESWHQQDESTRKGFHFVDIDGEDPNDDTCGICGDGGDLICCDSCPSTFHQSCLEIKKLPSGVWHCIYCLCKFCGMVGGNSCQSDDCNAAAISGLLTCLLCEEKYHHSCVHLEDARDDNASSSSFCGKNCQELYERLHMLLGVKHELEEGFSWSLIHRFDVGSDISLSGMPRKVECNSKIVVASSIMDECFLPMVDHRSGVNLIRNIVYNFGSNFKRLNYSGFITAILERRDEIISAASIRIHGKHLAEMPFIGTRHMYRRQGMCRRLLSGVETALCTLNVEKLVIPAISELMETWTSVFGFQPLEGLSKLKMRNMNMVMFPGVDMLQKPLLKDPLTEENMIPSEVSNSTKLEEHQTMDWMSNNSDDSCSAGFDKDSIEIRFPQDGNINGEATAIESGSCVPNSCLNGTCDMTSKISNGPVCPANSKCLDKLGVVPDKLEGRNESIVHPHNTLSDAHEQTTDVAEHKNAVSGSIFPPAEEAILELDAEMSQHDVSEVESKLPVVSHAQGANIGREHLSAPLVGTETASEVKIEDCNDEYNFNSQDDESMPMISEIITIPLDLAFENGVEVSENEAVRDKSLISSISCTVQIALLTAHQRGEDAVNGHCAVLPVACQGCRPDAGEKQNVAATVNPTSNDHVAAKPNMQACLSNGLCMSKEVTADYSDTNVDVVWDMKEASGTQTDTRSLHQSLTSDSLRMSKSSSSPASDADGAATHSNSESLCNSGSAPGVALHCASSGGNSCAPESLILSNQAS